jgi:PAS domain S-box-containing protein
MIFAKEIVNTLRESLLVLDEQFHVRTANRSFYEMFQVLPSQTEGVLVYELGNGQWDIPELHQLLEEVLPKHREIKDFEVTHHFEHLGKRTMLLNARTLVDENHLRLMLLAIEDVTEQKQAQTASFEHVMQLRMFIEHAPAALAMLDRQMRYLVASRRWITDYRLGDKNIIGLSHYQVFPEISESWKSVHMRALAGEVVRNEEDRFIRSDGSIHWLRWEVRPWYTAEGAIGGIVLFSEDITERKEVENDLRDSQAKLKSALNSMTDAVVFTDALGRFVDFNDAFLVFHRFRNEETLRVNLEDSSSLYEMRFSDGTTTPSDMWPIARALRGETGIEEEYHLRRKDSGESWIGSYSFAPIHSIHGEIIGSVVVARDITARVRAEIALRESQAQLTTEANSLIRLNKATSRLWKMRDLKTGLEEILHATIEMLSSDFGSIQVLDADGETLKIAAQHGFSERFPDFFREVNLYQSCACGRAFSSSQRVIVEDVRQDPEYAEFRDIAESSGYLAVQSTPLLSPEGHPLGMISTHWRVPHRPSEQELRRLDLYACQAADFILRCISDKALQDREKRLAAVLNTAADAVITIDQRGIMTSVNAATEKMFGYGREELVGQNVRMLMPAPYADEHDGYLKRYAATRQARVIGLGREALARRKDGTTFPVDLAVSEIDDLCLFTGIIRDISERKNLQRDILGILEDEQQRIGQDLHDSVQQELAGLGLLVQTLVDILTQESTRLDEIAAGQIADLTRKIKRGLSRTHEEIRSISRGLAPIRLDKSGLMEALRDLASRTDGLQSVACAFKCNRKISITKSFIATHLYRIAQEAVTNALKHANPSHILIELASDERHWILRIANDGISFDNQNVEKGLGLKTMQYRASLISGSLTISTIETGGTLITCRVYKEGVDDEE